MESYQDIKREGTEPCELLHVRRLTSLAENIKKMFYRWLASAKKARHRRLQLRAKEEEFKLTVIAGAWDRWRERFQDIRLQPMVSHVLCRWFCQSDDDFRPMLSSSNTKGTSFCEHTVSGIPSL